MTPRTAATLLIFLTAGVVLILAVPGPTRPGKEATALPAEPDQALAAILARIAVKQALIDHLIAGRATLADVSARFLELNRPRPAYMAGIRRNHPGQSDEESQARNVIACALVQIESPAEQSRLQSRLEAEFAALFPPDPAVAPTTGEHPYGLGPDR
jgi:hypothetical protein